jgi:tRNA pseudouridine55 synthase
MDPQTLAESGILLVDKPTEWTSHDVVNCVRRRFRLKKVGHCGTLDPGATGLLVLLIGKATKLSGKFMGQDKAYEGVIRLGAETSTQDAEGEVTATHPVADFAAEDVAEAAARYVGQTEQIPPMVSAVKKDGKRLYKLARQGIEVEREPRAISIHLFEITGVALPDVHFRLRCSKGTYVRTLAADLGADLGCGGHLHSLRRTGSGRFDVTQAFPMDTVKTWEREDLMQHMIPLHRMVDYV